ncbi:MAG: carboxypeptidase-like regulatory domain-containing protein, partial [Prosthecobacter sp.]|nr:carboxypeptidase-like regulatory domain-containing protein [Prosthecobacter sp.]
MKPSQGSLPTANISPDIPDDLKVKMNLLYLTPISFYGRVMDQNGAPVDGAKVEFSANTVPFGDGEKFSTTTDGSGNFEITGKHGRSLYVGVSKSGYYRVPEMKGAASSSGFFAYGSDLGDGVHTPSKKSPVIFILRKAGTLEPLVARRGIKVPLMPDGTEYAVSLQQSQGTNHRIVLSCRSEAMPEAGGAFDWSFEVKVEDGELADRTDDFAFEVPMSGYRLADSMAMSKSLSSEKWKDRVSKSYFIRFRDGT